MSLHSFGLLSSFLFASVSLAAPVTAVPALDVARYAGKWYEIASIPQIFSSGCSCTTAQYGLLEGGGVSVSNSCRVGSAALGFPISISGTARVPDSTRPAELKVKFFGPAEADYWVLSLADDYSYALVGAPDRNSLWILSRTPTLPTETYQALVALAREQEFDVSRLRLQRQEGCRD